MDQENVVLPIEEIKDVFDAEAYYAMRKIIDELEFRDKHRVLNDEKDRISKEPSYSRFRMPFYIETLHRYRQSVRRYEEQFQLEINNLIKYQATAADEARLTRHLAYTTFWPQLHNRYEIAVFRRKFFKMSEKEKHRLRLLMRG